MKTVPSGFGLRVWTSICSCQAAGLLFWGAVVFLLPPPGCADSPHRPFTFAVMGDVPYAEKEYDLLKRQLSELPDRVEFVFHVGDIKPGSLPCTESIYIRVAGTLRKSRFPVFVLPGDNEWNDCIVPPPGVAWSYWEKHFLRFDRQWNHQLPVRRQLLRPENMALVHNGTLLVGVNLVGGRVHDRDEWEIRQKQDVQWLQKQFDSAGTDVSCAVVLGHAFPKAENKKSFETGFLKVAAKFDRPIVYLHGDGHKWTHDRPWKTHPHIERIQVDQGGIAPPLLVTPTHNPRQPFRFDRRSKK